MDSAQLDPPSVVRHERKDWQVIGGLYGYPESSKHGCRFGELWYGRRDSGCGSRLRRYFPNLDLHPRTSTAHRFRTIPWIQSESSQGIFWPNLVAQRRRNVECSGKSHILDREKRRARRSFSL